MLANPPEGTTDNSSGWSEVKRSGTRGLRVDTEKGIPERSEGMDRYGTTPFHLNVTGFNHAPQRVPLRKLWVV
jgi:hypothetical protein